MANLRDAGLRRRSRDDLRPDDGIRVGADLDAAAFDASDTRRTSRSVRLDGGRPATKELQQQRRGTEHTGVRER